MVVLRATRKLWRSLPPSRALEPESDTALGDWYVNRLVVDKRPLLLLASSKALLSIVVPAREVAVLPERLETLVFGRITRLGVPPRLVRAEVAAMSPIVIAPTRDRSVLGTMTEFAHMIPLYLEPDLWGPSDLLAVETVLQQVPCRRPGDPRAHLFPEDEALRLLASRWGRER